MKDVPIQTKLLLEHDLTFEKAKDLAMSMEMGRSDLKLMSGAESDQRIHNVHYKHLKCYRCGDNHMIKDCKMKSVKHLAIMPVTVQRQTVVRVIKR